MLRRPKALEINQENRPHLLPQNHPPPCSCRQGVPHPGSSADCSGRGNPFVPVAVESIEIDARPAVHPGIHLGTFQDRVPVRIHDSRRRAAVCVHEIRIRVGLVIRPFRVAISQRRLQRGKCRYGPAVSFQLALPFLVGCLNGSLDLLDCLGVRLRDDQGTEYLGAPPLIDFGSHALT